MISYVLVMIVSLATGQPSHAFVEGPMSDSWCRQLIQRDEYTGQTGEAFRVASCLRWPDAQLELAQNSCRPSFAPSQHTRRLFECAAAEQGGSSAVASAEARNLAPTPTATAAPLGDQVPRPDQRRSHLGMAATALVAQAHAQIHAGKFGFAEETIERALRIEPDNPLLWVELGELWMTEGDAAQADGTSRRALALAVGDPQVQAAAWRLIAESLRARGRNPEAVDADREAIALAAQ